MRLRSSALAACSVFVAALAVTAPAFAEPTTWLSVGGGYGLERNTTLATMDGAGAMSLGIGIGTSSKNALVVGSMFRSTTYFSLGTDISLSLRVATRGFARGDWGLAFDGGVVGRFWKDRDHGRYPLQAVVTAGIPFGFQLGVGAQFWNVTGQAPYATGGFCVIELDLLRLTVMRQGSTERFWPNPAPAGGRDIAGR